MLQFDDRHGDVGAMVGNPLVVGQQIRKDEAQFDGAAPRLQPCDVM